MISGCVLDLYLNELGVNVTKKYCWIESFTYTVKSVAAEHLPE